jgi:hypothetical protein
VINLGDKAWPLPKYNIPCNTVRKYGTGSSPDEIIELFPLYLILPAALDPGVCSAANRNEYQKNLSGRKARPTRKAGLFCLSASD